MTFFYFLFPFFFFHKNPKNRETEIKTSEVCSSCNGTGEVQASILIIDEIENSLKFLIDEMKSKTIILNVHPFIEAFLKTHPNYCIQDAKDYIPNKYVDKNGAMFTYPPKHKIDGGYAVRLQRSD